MGEYVGGVGSDSKLCEVKLIALKKGTAGKADRGAVAKAERDKDKLNGLDDKRGKRKREEEVEDKSKVPQLIERVLCPEFGIGWECITKKRGVAAKHIDKSYVSPEGKQFNSRVKVRSRRCALACPPPSARPRYTCGRCSSTLASPRTLLRSRRRRTRPTAR